MKKILLWLIFLVIIAFPSKTFAFQQTEAVCYSQCLAYKFVWQGTYCYDVFADNCTEEKGNTIIKTIKFIKSVYDVVKSGDNIDIPFKAMFVCKPLIESCIVPNQENCNQACQTDINMYTPDLSVGHQESNFQGVYYDESSKQLFFKLVNNGMGYAWDIEIEATAGHTPNRDGNIQNDQQLFKEKVEHLIYLGARNGPPKSFSDSVGDFLIEQSLNGQYLHNFKSWVVSSLDLHSDSNNYNVPNYWIKAIPFTPVPGELNQITFKVDPNQVIPEVRELNNTFVLDIDLRPTPARYDIETIEQNIIEGTLNSFLVNFKVKNTGEESGKAIVKIYDGKYQNSKTPIYQSEENISAKSDKSFETTINIDVSAEANTYCGKFKEYTTVIFDEEGNKTERSFSLPIYIASVNGRVVDMFGKAVKNANIKAITEQETQTSNIGYYHLKGITTLGKIIITASHPEFSKPDSKEIEFNYGDEFNACKEGYLLFNSVNFILKDQEVIFTVTIKDPQGNLVKAKVLAVNSDFREEQEINGSGTMPQLQPGKYLFTISALGYKTIRQNVNAVPDNNNLEFVLEKLAGRPDDNGIKLITPKLLWKKTLGDGERIIGDMRNTKNGQLLVTLTGNNKTKTASLFFNNLITGNQIKETQVPYTVMDRNFVDLDTSYEGNTVGLFTKQSEGDNVLKIFDSSGKETGTTTLDKKTSILMRVSPDGFYVCTNLLLDKGLHKYTGHEIEGKGDDNFDRNPVNCGDYILRNNNLIDSCKEGLCEVTISGQVVRVVGDINEKVKTNEYDSAVNDSTVTVRTYKKLYYFGQTSWSKELKSDNDYKSVAVSAGGMYTIVTEGSGASSSLKLKIFDNNGNDKTPDFPYKNVKFVFANDKGIFFAQVTLNQVELYQIGEYQSEYNLGSVTPTSIPQWVNDISIYSNGQYSPIQYQTFASLDPGVIYRADKSLKLNIIKPYTANSLGALSITKDSLFAVDWSYNPILIKGQMTANFGSPATIYAIKFDRYSSWLFEEKLSKFVSHQLPENEYFVVQNIHTIFSLKNSENIFNLSVENGQVNVTVDKTVKSVVAGKQITVDKFNKISETVYVSFKFWVIGGGIIILAIGLFFYLKRSQSPKSGKIK